MHTKNIFKIKIVLSLIVAMAVLGVVLNFRSESAGAVSATPGCYLISSKKVTESGDTYTKFTFTKVNCPKDSKSFYVVDWGPSSTPDPGHCYALNGSGASSYNGGKLYSYVIPSTGQGYCSWMHDKLNATGRYTDKATLVDATSGGGTNPGGGGGAAGGGGGTNPGGGGDSETPKPMHTAAPSGGREAGDTCENFEYAEQNPDDCSFAKIVLVPIIQALSAAAGIIIVISVVVAGIQYIASNGSAQTVAAAKSRLSRAALALIIYIVGFALLAWLIPGALFG